jgi:hypothetical protein
LLGQLLQLQEVKQKPMALGRQEDKLDPMPLPDSDSNTKLIPCSVGRSEPGNSNKEREERHCR